jgi:hypothetical protein
MNPTIKNITAFTYGVPSSISWELLYSQRSLSDWLVLIALWLWLVKINQLQMNSCLEGCHHFKSFGMKRVSRKVPILVDLASYINRSETWLSCTPHVSLKSSALHFETWNFNNLKEPYLSLLLKEAEKFLLRTNEQFKNTWLGAVNWLQGFSFPLP